MASSYYDSSGFVVFDGDIAEAADLNAVNTAIDSAFQLVESDVAGAGSDAAYYAGVAELWASEDEDTLVSATKYSALHYAAKAAATAASVSSSVSAAAASAAAALASENAAETAETNAETAETNAETAQGLAEDAQAAAEAAQAAAETAETNAETAETNAAASASAASTSETNAAASELAASGYEADVVAAGAAQIALVEAEGDDQFARISALDAVLKSDDTGAAYIPTGTTAQRDATPQTGMFRYNTTEEEFEGYDGTEWGTIGGGGSPIGTIIMWPLDAAPTGYLICDGSTYNVNTYPELGALFGGIAGGTFDVPDISSFVKASQGTNTNTDEAESVGTHGHTAAAVADHDHGAATSSDGSHNHSASTNNTGNHNHSYSGRQTNGWYLTGGGGGQIDDMNGTSYTGYGGSHSHSVSVNSNGAHTHTITAGGGHTPSINNHTGTNQPACTLINFCIKAE